jgi:hypothetical protein
MFLDIIHCLVLFKMLYFFVRFEVSTAVTMMIIISQKIIIINSTFLFKNTFRRLDFFTVFR